MLVHDGDREDEIMSRVSFSNKTRQEGKARQDKTRQGNKAKQNKTKQNKAKRGKARQDVYNRD